MLFSFWLDVVWLFWFFALVENSRPRSLTHTSQPVGLPATSPNPCIQKPQYGHTFTDPELWVPRLVRSEGTSPMAVGIILSPFWYVSLFCPLQKIWRSMVWAGMAASQRIQGILSHCRAGHTPMSQHSTMSLLLCASARKVSGWRKCVPSGPPICTLWIDWPWWILF